MKNYDSLRGDAEFRRVRSGKKVSHSGPMAVFQGPGSGEAVRLGIVAPAKLGSAVQRNRAKRRIRAAFAKEVNEHFAGIDFVIHAKSAAIDADFTDLRSAIRASIRTEPHVRAPKL